MTVVVTGASGHVGANLTRALLEAKRSVRVTVREDTRGVDGLDVQRVKADVRDPASLLEAFAGADVVYHLAAMITIDGDRNGEVQRVNVEGARNVAQACLQCGVKRLVHFSSIHALSHLPTEQAINEERPLAVGQKLPTYDRSKSEGEQEIMAAVAGGLDAVIINPTAILGPHDYKPSALGQVLLDLCRKKMFGLVEGGFDWVDVRDVVQTAIVAETRGRTGERYLLSGKWRSVKELAGVVEEVSGVPAPRFVTPMWLARMSAPAAVAFNRIRGKAPLFTGESLRALRCHRLISHEKATRELGYTPRPLKETIEATLEWFREVQWI